MRIANLLTRKCDGKEMNTRMPLFNLPFSDAEDNAAEY